MPVRSGKDLANKQMSFITATDWIALKFLRFLWRDGHGFFRIYESRNVACVYIVRATHAFSEEGERSRTFGSEPKYGGEGLHFLATVYMEKGQGKGRHTG